MSVIITVPRTFGGTLLLTIPPSQASISVTAVGSDGLLSGIGLSEQISGIGSSSQINGVGQSEQIVSIGLDGLISGKD